MKPNILLATPTVGAMVTTEYLHTVTSLVRCEDFSVTVETLDTSELFRARSYFAAKLVQNPQYTHLLFVDSDIGFNVSLLKKMLSFNKDFTSALCPFRYTDSSGKLKFICEDKIITTVDNFVKMSKIGAGVLLLTPNVINKISKNFPQLDTSDNSEYYTSKGLKGKINQCFAPIANAAGDYLSEDLSFCWRWTYSGGEIWACTDESVTHVGKKNFTGTFKESI